MRHMLLCTAVRIVAVWAVGTVSVVAVDDADRQQGQRPFSLVLNNIDGICQLIIWHPATSICCSDVHMPHCLSNRSHANASCVSIVANVLRQGRVD
jgi:hypothetical protein